MKKLLSVSLATLAFAAVADYQPITVGVTTIKPTTQNAIIPVPYTKIGSSADVSVHDLVKAANLPNNTMLYYFDGTNYKAWKKNSSGAWATPDAVATIGSAAVTAGTDEINVSVGAALWVAFPDGTALDEQSIVVYGSPAAATNSTIVANKINLLANPTATTVSGSVLADKLSPAVKDTIIPIGSVGTYVYSGNAYGWVHTAPDAAPERNATLPNIGQYQGFWYISKTSGANKTIAW